MFLRGKWIICECFLHLIY